MTVRLSFMRHEFLIMTAVLTMVSVLKGRAQTDVDTLAHRMLDDVEVTAHAPSHSVTSAMPTREISRERMRRLGLTALPDALRQLAGVTVRDYGGIGGMKTVSVRNLGAHHTAFSYDGIVVGNTQAGQIDLSHYQLDNVSRLSFAVGQETSLLQSARHYASAGVVSVVTDEEPSPLRVSLRGGAFGYVSPRVRCHRRLSDATALTLDGAFLRADGSYPFTLRNGRFTTRERRQGSDVTVWQGEANLRHHFADGGRLHVKAQGHHSERGLPGSVVLYNPNNRERMWDEDFAFQALYIRELGANPQPSAFNSQTPWSLAVRMRYDHSWSHYDDINVKYADGRQTDLNSQSEYYTSATLAWQPRKSLGMALAEDVIYNTLRNNIYDGVRPHRLTSLTALTAFGKWNRLTANASLMATRSHRSPQDAYEGHWGTSCGLLFRMGGGASLRAMMKQTFRQPSFNDLYYRRFGNVNLRPEKAAMYGVGITWSGSIYRNVYVETTVDGYYNHVRDKIVAFPTTYVWRMMNLGRVDITGLDATLEAQWSPVSRWSVDITAAYTLQQAVDKTDRRQSFYGQQIPYTPRHSGTASAVVSTPLVDIGYSLQACGERYSALLHNADARMKPYAEHNVTLSRSFRLRRCQLALSASLMNLTDEQFDIIQFYPMPGRHWQAGVVMSFD